MKSLTSISTGSISILLPVYPYRSVLVSDTFLDEATNRLSDTFLDELFYVNVYFKKIIKLSKNIKIIIKFTGKLPFPKPVCHQKISLLKDYIYFHLS